MVRCAHTRPPSELGSSGTVGNKRSGRRRRQREAEFAALWAELEHPRTTAAAEPGPVRPPRPTNASASPWTRICETCPCLWSHPSTSTRLFDWWGLPRRVARREGAVGRPGCGSAGSAATASNTRERAANEPSARAPIRAEPGPGRPNSPRQSTGTATPRHHRPRRGEAGRSSQPSSRRAPLVLGGAAPTWWQHLCDSGYRSCRCRRVPVHSRSVAREAGCSHGDGR